MEELETLEGHVENRDPETEVLVKRSTAGSGKAYHEKPPEWELGDSPPCGSRSIGNTPNEYEVITLKEAINKWAEPCNHVECVELRTDGLARDDYKKGDFLRDKFWREKMTQSQIADEVGVDKKTIRRWMNRNNIPTTKEEYERVHDEEPPCKRFRDVTEEEREQIVKSFNKLFKVGRRGTKVHLRKSEGVSLCHNVDPEILKPVEPEEVKDGDICKQCMRSWRC